MKRFILSGLIIFGFIYVIDAAETVSGTVFDSGTGKPAVGVTVGLRELDIVTETDSRGEFSFSGIEKGFYELTFSHQDYGNVSVNIRVKRNFYIVRNLIPKAFDAGNRTKVYDDSLHSKGERTITRDDIKKYPMRGAGDSLHLLQSLPGIGGSFSLATVPIIRGTNPLFNKYYIDDIPVDCPYHYAAGFIPLFSSINEEALDSVQVIKGNAPLWTGDNLGNTIMIRSADAEREGVHGKMILDPLIPFMPTFSVSIVPNDRFSMTAVGRRTTPDLLIDMNKTHFYMADYFLKASYIVNDAHRITALVTGSQDDISFKSLKTRSGYSANGITWEFRALDDLMFKTVLSNQNMVQSLKNKKDYDAESGAEIEFNPDQYRILQTATLSLKDINIRAGYEAVKYSGGCSGNTSLADIAGTDFYKETGGSMNLSFPVEGTSVSGFAGVDGTLSSFFYDAGVKFENYSPIEEKAFSYTLNAGYQMNAVSSVYVKHGTYYAHPDVYYYLGNIDPDFKLAEAENFAAGMNLIPLKEIFLNAEIYYSRFDNMNPDTIFNVDDDVIKKLMQLHPYSKEEDGSNFGIELSGRGSFKGFDGWLSYSFSRTSRNNTGESSYRSDYEQAHLLRLVLSRTWKKWSASAIWHMMSSLPYTPVSRFLYDGSSYTTDYGKRNSANFALNKRLDLRGIYTTDSGTRISVECWNVLFFRNNTVALETNTSSTEKKFDIPFFIWCSLEKPL